MKITMNRRQFISSACVQCAGLAMNHSLLDRAVAAAGKTVQDSIKDLIDNKHIFEIKKAQYFSQLPNKKIRCEICPRKCEVDHMERGFCGNRENREGAYYILAYSNPCAVHIDPIEKKPLFHYLPTSLALSISTAGCNMMCKFCQNWQISQFRPEQTDNVFCTPDRIVDIARSNNTNVIAYTYAEPVVFYEYMYDCAEKSRIHNIHNVMISAGYINPKPLRKLIKVLDAVKIDLKAFSQKYYEDICSAELDPVLECLQILKEEKIWFEIVYLVVPTLNDDLPTIRQMSKWIKANLGTDVPVHYSRFHPTYMLKNLQPTPVSTLENIRKATQDAGINYVYIGNVWNHEGENTYCPSCGKVLVHRVGYQVIENHIQSNKCEYCGRHIAGIWEN